MTDQLDPDSYMECHIYAKHGACSCSTGVPGNVCPTEGVPTVTDQPVRDALREALIEGTQHYEDWPETTTLTIDIVLATLRSLPVEERMEAMGMEPHPTMLTSSRRSLWREARGYRP